MIKWPAEECSLVLISFLLQHIHIHPLSLILWSTNRHLFYVGIAELWPDGIHADIVEFVLVFCVVVGVALFHRCYYFDGYVNEFRQQTDRQTARQTDTAKR